MPSYLVESYLADSPDAVEGQRERARSLADEAAGVRYVRTTFLPGDETILHVFEAPSRGALRRAALLADLAHERIVEAVEPAAYSPPRLARDDQELRQPHLQQPHDRIVEAAREES